MPRRRLTFGDFEINTSKRIVTDFNSYTVTDFQQDTKGLGPRNGQAIVSEIYREREIEITGVILGDNQIDADTEFQDLQTNVEATGEQTLEYEWNGFTRQVTCRADPIQMRYWRPMERGFRIVLRSTTVPYAEDTEETQVTYQDITNSTETRSPFFDGTAPPAPVVTISFDSVNNTSGVTFNNKTTGTSTEVRPTNVFSAGDALEFNVRELTVKLNGDEVFYTDTFPKFVTGTNDLEFIFDSDSQQYDIRIKNRARYL